MLRLTWVVVILFGLIVVSGCQHETSVAVDSNVSSFRTGS